MRNNKCAFLTMDNLKELGFVSDDEVVYPYLEELGWEIELIPWRRENVLWDNYDVVLVRSPWDYQSDPEKFLSVLENITNSRARLENPVDIIRWNMNKEYLLDLESEGVLIPHTIKGIGINEKRIVDFFNALRSEEIIIKPTVSANADNTFRLNRSNYRVVLADLIKIFEKREYLVQPFRENVLREGEYSLFFFGGKLSHAIVKIPKLGDFRVQEEHGGIISGIEPTQQLIESAGKVLSALDRKLLYARVDLVRNNENKFELMELELIEPSLYFRFNDQAPHNFASAFNKWVENY